jgi:hypothetical protein
LLDSNIARDTTAALMNCGRAPIIVTIFMNSPAFSVLSSRPSQQQKVSFAVNRFQRNYLKNEVNGFIMLIFDHVIFLLFLQKPVQDPHRVIP